MARLSFHAPQPSGSLPVSELRAPERPPVTIESMLKSSGVPDRYWDRTFDTFEATTEQQKVAFARVRRWVAEPLGPGGMFLYGPPGTGKTHLLVGALREKLLQGVRGIRYVNVPLLLDELRAAIKYTDAPAMERFEYLRDDARVVVLDDLGREKATDWATERLYVLVEARYARLRPTLASSNQSLNGLRGSGYDALVSRLLENGPALALSGADFRMVR